jgi:tol-pal system protein YbgF
MSLPMIRSFSLPAALVACVLGASAARAQVSDADLVTRIGRLEATIRELTGRVEQLQYRNQQLELQMQRLQEEALRSEEAKGQTRPPSQAGMRPTAQNPQPPYSPPPGGAGVVTSQAVPPAVETPPPSGGRRGDAFDPAANPNAPGVPRPLGTSTAANEPPPPVSDASGPRQIGAPLDLSTPIPRPPADLPPPPPSNPSGTGAMQATLPPASTPRDQYDLAYGYVLHKDYALAAESFRGFLRQYPTDRLVPEAQYWLGESLFQQQQYRDAAESFLAVSTKYETTARAPEALLRPARRSVRFCANTRTHRQA